MTQTLLCAERAGGLFTFVTFVCRDQKGQTPYVVAPDKDTRNVFRKYMGDNPDRYDYKKAQVRE